MISKGKGKGYKIKDTLSTIKDRNKAIVDHMPIILREVKRWAHRWPLAAMHKEDLIQDMVIAAIGLYDIWQPDKMTFGVWLKRNLPLRMISRTKRLPLISAPWRVSWRDATSAIFQDIFELEEPMRHKETGSLFAVPRQKLNNAARDLEQIAVEGGFEAVDGRLDTVSIRRHAESVYGGKRSRRQSRVRKGNVGRDVDFYFRHVIDGESPHLMAQAVGLTRQAVHLRIKDVESALRTHPWTGR